MPGWVARLRSAYFTVAEGAGIAPSARVAALPIAASTIAVHFRMSGVFIALSPSLWFSPETFRDANHLEGGRRWTPEGNRKRFRRFDDPAMTTEIRCPTRC